jgi:hypothetical protein
VGHQLADEWRGKFGLLIAFKTKRANFMFLQGNPPALLLEWKKGAVGP